MRPAISINTLCLETAPLEHHVEFVAKLGARMISPTIEDVTGFGAGAAARCLRDAGLSVATLTHRAFGFATQAETEGARERLYHTIDLAEVIGASSVMLTTGGRGACDWRQAVTRFADAIAPCAARAHEAGLALAIEPTSHLYADASIAHRLADTVTIAREAGIGLGIDLFACWFDADIDRAIEEAASLAVIVQVSDYVAQDRGLPCRAVPGDGMVPLDRLLPAILSAGYRGPVDLEIIGPRLYAEGREAGLARAIAYVGAILDRSAS